MKNEQRLRDLLDSAILEATGSVFVAEKKIYKGEISNTYDVELSDGRHIIAKTLVGNVSGYEGEKWCFDKLKNIDNVPIPRILLVKHTKVDDQIVSICIQEKKDGDSIRGSKYFRSLGSESRKEIINQAGKILSQIHTIKMDRFGYIDHNGTATFKSFPNLMDSYFGNGDTLVGIARKMGIQERSIQRIVHNIRCILKKVRGEELFPVLNHNDYTLDHIIINDKGEITAIIDWGEAQGNLSLNDFAKWDFWCSQLAPTEWLREGYANIIIDEGLYGDILHVMRCLIGLRAYTWYSNGRVRLSILKKIQFELDKDFRYLEGIRT